MECLTLQVYLCGWVWTPASATVLSITVCNLSTIHLFSQICCAFWMKSAVSLVTDMELVIEEGSHCVLFLMPKCCNIIFRCLLHINKYCGGTGGCGTGLIFHSHLLLLFLRPPPPICIIEAVVSCHGNHFLSALLQSLILLGMVGCLVYLCLGFIPHCGLFSLQVFHQPCPLCL